MVANRCTIDLQLILEEEESQTVHTVIIRSDTDGRKKRQPLVSVIPFYFEKETLLHQSNTIHLHTIPTHSPSIKTPNCEVKAEIFSLPAKETVNLFSSNHHHAQERSFAIVPLHPFTHEVPEH